MVSLQAAVESPYKEAAKTRQTHRPAAKAAQTGLLFALAICLSYIEGLVPAPFAVPGIKLGLSNIVVMYAVFALGWRSAVLLAVLKGLFVLFARGLTGALLAFCGGVLSVLVMLLVLRIAGRRASYALVSMVGAVAHNLGQLAAAAVLLQLQEVFWFYLPVLVTAGIVAGLLTATLLRAVMPLMNASKPL